MSQAVYSNPEEPAGGPARRRGCWFMVVVLAILAVCGGGTGAALLSLAGEPNEIRVAVAPDRITAMVGEPVTVELTIENVSLDTVTVTSIGFDDSFTGAVQLAEMNPPFRATGKRDYPLLGSWTDYQIDQRIFAGDTLTVTLTLVGSQTGNYSGDLTVWVENRLAGLPVERARHASLEIQLQ